MDYGKETLTLFEIDQPLCPLVYSEAPCAASLGTTGDKKCFNTRATCQDTDNYRTVAGSPDVDNFLVLRFSRNQQGLMAYGPFIPSLEEITTTPGSLNLAAMDRDSAAMGNREVLTVVFNDHKHSDNLVDPYRLERNIETGSPSITVYDPYESGTFWGKWLARNPFKSAYRCRIYEGFVGDAIADMRVRNYVIDSVDGPNDGQVTMTCIDLFTLIDRQKAVAPVASLGELDANITDVAGSATLSPTGIGNLEYPASGLLQIADELITYTRSGDALTLTARGAHSTTAEAHDQEDLVQVVLEYTQISAVDIVYDLLLNYTTLTTDELPKTDWDVAAADLPEVYTTRIGTSVPVIELVGELSEQAGFTLWPDVTSGTILFSALRAKDSLATVTDNEWIIDESLSIIDQIDRRASQVWVYYAQINATKDLDEKRNYRSRVVTVDVAAEGEFEYAIPAIKEIFSRWITQFGRSLAIDTGERIINMFRDPPKEAEFKMHIGRNSQFGLADFVSLETSEIQDDTGIALPTTMAVVEKRIDENEIAIRAQQVTFGETTLLGERVLFLEDSENNKNLRTIHDLNFSTPLGGSPGEVVRFIVSDGVIIGSDSTSLYALQTGSWPEGVSLILEVGTATGSARIQGRAGNAGAGASDSDSGVAGGGGGPAIFAEVPIYIDNTNGEIWGGGGGGGGGGSAYSTFGAPFLPSNAGGGGGGGGAGTIFGSAGGGGITKEFGAPHAVFGSAGANGSSTAAGSGGARGTLILLLGGAGGAGGGPGLAGAAGANASGGNTSNGTGGSAGAAGNYITGNAFVSWIDNGDQRGGAA